MDPLSILLASLVTVAATEAASHLKKTETLEEKDRRQKLAIENFVREMGNVEISRELTPLQKMMWEQEGVMVCPHGTQDFQESNLDWLVHKHVPDLKGEPRKILFRGMGEHIGNIPFDWLECYHYHRKTDGSKVQIHAAWWPPLDAILDYDT